MHGDKIQHQVPENLNILACTNPMASIGKRGIALGTRSGSVRVATGGQNVESIDRIMD